MKPVWNHIFLGIALWAVASAILLFNFNLRTSNLHFLWLADSFLHHRLDLPHDIIGQEGLMDVTVRAGKYFWPLGPLPAVIFMPLVGFFGATDGVAVVLQLAICAAAAWFAYSLARRKGLGISDSLWSAVALLGGSVALGILVQHGPWYMGQALVLALVLAACAEHAKKDRPWIIGALIALAATSRVTAALVLGYFILETLTRREKWPHIFVRLMRLCLPMLAALLILGAYDQARFGSPFDHGYSDQTLLKQELIDRRAAGLFHPSHMAHNAWYYFLRLPEFRPGGISVDPAGVSIFLLSPVFLLAFLPPEKRARRKWAVATFTCAAITAVFLAYYAEGERQFGPRYLNEAMPLAFLLLVARFKEKGLGSGAKAVILLSSILNVALFWFYLQS